MAPAALGSWSAVEEKAAWAAAQAALLRRVARLVERLMIGRRMDVANPLEDCTPRVLYDSGGPAALVAQPGLRPLELALWDEPSQTHDGMAAVVPGLTRLRSLLVHHGYDLRQHTTQAIRNLAPRLRSLELHACFIREEQVEAALACTGLTRLALRPCGQRIRQRGGRPAAAADAPHASEPAAGAVDRAPPHPVSAPAVGPTMRPALLALPPHLSSHPWLPLFHVDPL